MWSYNLDLLCSFVVSQSSRSSLASRSQRQTSQHHNGLQSCAGEWNWSRFKGQFRCGNEPYRKRASHIPAETIPPAGRRREALPYRYKLLRFGDLRYLNWAMRLLGTARANIAATYEHPEGTQEGNWAREHQNQTVCLFTRPSLKSTGWPSVQVLQQHCDYFDQVRIASLHTVPRALFSHAYRIKMA